MQIIEEIKKISSLITDDELSKLRIEEEMLTMLVRCSKFNLQSKKKAFTRIEQINKLQLQILGSIRG